MNLFKLPDRLYDFIKKLVTVVLPAGTALATGLAAVWGWDVRQIVESTGLVALFLGAVLGISNVPFQRAGGGVVGDLRVVTLPGEDGSDVRTTVVAFEEDPGVLKDGQELKLKFKETPTDISGL